MFFEDKVREKKVQICHYLLDHRTVHNMDMDPETALLVHANKVFFTAVELAAQKETKKAVAEFDKAIKLYNMLSVSTYSFLSFINL